MWSNPIADHVLEELEITAAERDVVRKTMENMHREKTGGRGPLTLTAPINIGIGTK